MSSLRERKESNFQSPELVGISQKRLSRGRFILLGAAAIAGRFLNPRMVNAGEEPVEQATTALPDLPFDFPYPEGTTAIMTSSSGNNWSVESYQLPPFINQGTKYPKIGASFINLDPGFLYAPEKINLPHPEDYETTFSFSPTPEGTTLTISYSSHNPQIPPQEGSILMPSFDPDIPNQLRYITRGDEGKPFYFSRKGSGLRPIRLNFERGPADLTINA